MTPEQRQTALTWALGGAMIGLGVTAWVVGLRASPKIWLALVAVILVTTVRAWGWIGRRPPSFDDHDDGGER